MSLCSLLPAQDLRLGRIDFPVTVKSETANAAFIKGVLLLHSFEYEDAAEAFQEAQQIEPDFYMAYWGEAMTHNHPIWHRQYKEKGISALMKLSDMSEDRLIQAPTEREQYFMEAVEILFGDGTKEERDFWYRDHLKKMHERYPEDLEVTAFYALSILGANQGPRDYSTYMKAAFVAETVYEQNPDHPGALHYLIHSYDDPVHAVLGLRAAHRYAKVAPAAAHALHMPSHIFVATGDWDRVVASNEDSWRASLARIERKGLKGYSDRGYHSFWWLMYGYTQQGNATHAKMLLDSMYHDSQRSDHGRVEYHLAVMRASYLIDTEDWESEAFDMEPNWEVINPKTQAIYHFTTGYVAWKRGTLNQLQQATEAIEALLPKENLPITTTGEAAQCCAVPDGSELSEEAVKTLRVMIQTLKALQRHSEGNHTAAITLMESAATQEAALGFMFGPPVIPKPTHELLGEMLLAAGKNAAAAEAFEAGLKRTPNRRLAVEGLEKANEGQN